MLAKLQHLFAGLLALPDGVAQLVDRFLGDQVTPGQGTGRPGIAQGVQLLDQRTQLRRPSGRGQPVEQIRQLIGGGGADEGGDEQQDEKGVSLQHTQFGDGDVIIIARTALTPLGVGF